MKTNMDLLDRVRLQSRHLSPQPGQPVGEAGLREAAVLIALTQSDDPSVVFIKRAAHLNSHAGQVAFPGGMWEPSDQSLLHTALRESEEEIALPPDSVEVIAALPARTTRYNVRVSPYLGIIPAGLTFVPELDELESVFQVPLAYLSQPGNLTAAEISLPEGRCRVPCFVFDNYCIWGFTLQVVADILDTTFGLHLPLDYQWLD